MDQNPDNGMPLEKAEFTNSIKYPTFVEALHDFRVSPDRLRSYLAHRISEPQSVTEQIAYDPIFEGEMLQCLVPVNRREFYCELVTAYLVMALSPRNYTALLRLDGVTMYCAVLDYVYEQQYVELRETPQSLQVNTLFKILYRMAQVIEGTDTKHDVEVRFNDLLNEVELPLNQFKMLLEEFDRVQCIKAPPELLKS